MVLERGRKARGYELTLHVSLVRGVASLEEPVGNSGNSGSDW
jgi:hypothetical protein